MEKVKGSNKIASSDSGDDVAAVGAGAGANADEEAVAAPAAAGVVPADPVATGGSSPVSSAIVAETEASAVEAPAAVMVPAAAEVPSTPTEAVRGGSYAADVLPEAPPPPERTRGDIVKVASFASDEAVFGVSAEVCVCAHAYALIG